MYTMALLSIDVFTLSVGGPDILAQAHRYTLP